MSHLTEMITPDEIELVLVVRRANEAQGVLEDLLRGYGFDALADQRHRYRVRAAVRRFLEAQLDLAKHGVQATPSMATMMAVRAAEDWGS